MSPVPCINANKLPAQNSFLYILNPGLAFNIQWSMTYHTKPPRACPNQCFNLDHISSVSLSITVQFCFIHTAEWCLSAKPEYVPCQHRQALNQWTVFVLVQAPSHCQRMSSERSQKVCESLL